MAVAVHNIEIPKYNYKIIEITVKESQKTTKLDSTDNICLTVRPASESSEIMLFKELNSGITYNEQTGVYEVEINSEDTKDFEVGVEYGYDITIYIGGTKPKQKLIGTFKVTPQYSRKGVEENG